MQVSLELDGKRGKKLFIRFSLDQLTNQVFIEAYDGTAANKKFLASKLEPRGGVAGRLLAGWFGSEK